MLALGVVAVSGCGTNANAANCSTSVAEVANTAIAKTQYQALLTYTLAFAEKANTQSQFYGKNICHDAALARDCASIKRDLQSRMIDQQIVSDYAAKHGLLPDGADWNKALRAEAQIVKKAGGETAFLALLAKLGTDEAQFRWIESQQIETDKVIKAMGSVKFHTWLRGQESSSAVVRCPV